jgi:hypothetical protein
MSRRRTFSPVTGTDVRCSTKWRKTRTLLEHPPSPPPRHLLDAAITRPHRANQGHFTRLQRGVVRCRSTGVASERSPEGESENASSETRPRWPRRTPGGVALDHPEPTTLRPPASGRQMSRRRTFSPVTGADVRCSTKWRKTRTLLEHPPSPPPHRQTLPSLDPTGPTKATSHAFSEGWSDADPPAWRASEARRAKARTLRVRRGHDGRGERPVEWHWTTPS